MRIRITIRTTKNSKKSQQELYESHLSKMVNDMKDGNQKTLSSDLKKQEEKLNEYVKQPKFAPFDDPNGIPYEEHQKQHALDPKESRFVPFADPNGVPSKISQEIPHGYSHARVVKTYLKNRYNNQEELDR